MGTSQGKDLVGALAIVREWIEWLLILLIPVFAGFALIPTEWRNLLLGLLQQRRAERKALTHSPTGAGGILPLDQDA